MLNEVPHVTQYEPGQYRRWFHDEYFNLYTWESADGDLRCFQLCYGKDDVRRARRWSPEAGYRHEGVDSPEDKPVRAMSAIFVVDGIFDQAAVAERFERDALALPEKVCGFVLGACVPMAPSPHRIDATN